MSRFSDWAVVWPHLFRRASAGSVSCHFSSRFELKGGQGCGSVGSLSADAVSTPRLPHPPDRQAIFLPKSAFSADSHTVFAPQWGAADAEIKVPSVENTELEGSPRNIW